MENFDEFWAVYSNLVLFVGTNSLLAISIWLTLACGMLTMANSPSHVLQSQPFLENFCTNPTLMPSE